MNQTLIFLAGCADIGFAIFHVFFWKLFGWPAGLKASGSVNSGITQTLNIMLTLVFLLYGGKLIAFGWAGTQPDPYMLVCGILFGVVRSALQPVMFGMQGIASKGFLAIALAVTSLHAAVLLG